MRGVRLAFVVLPGLAAVGWLAAGGCGDSPAPAPPPPPAPAVPAPGPAPAAATAAVPPPTVRYTPLFEAETGFGPMNHTGIPGEKQWIAEAMGGAAILFDYDGDGDVDILFVDGNICAAPPHPDARSRLYRNEGGMKFTEVTKESGIDITGIGYGGAAADYDGDGDMDVHVGTLGKNHLLRNDADGTFTDVAAEAGVEGPERDMSTACAWADFDGDGWLDLYVSNYLDMHRIIEEFRKEGRSGRDCDWRGFKVYCGPMGPAFKNACQRDRLYLSNGRDPATGKVTFRDATDNLRGQVTRPSFQCIAADFDGDGDMDVYTAADTEPNSLWINDGKGMFTDEGMIAGCAYAQLVVPQASMGVDVSDYDHDGRMDIAVTNFSHDYDTVYRNVSTARKSGGRMAAFEDVSVQVGVSQPTFIDLAWTISWTDFDNDGDKDLFISNGHVYGEIDRFASSGTSYAQRNNLLENLGGRSPVFREVRDQVGPGLQIAEVHRGGAWADLDEDGDEDLVVCVLNGKAYILRNDGGNANAWLKVSLKGWKPLDPAGAVVKVEAAGLLPQWDVSLRGDSFCSCSDRRLLFGMGGAAKADRVTVTWPSGAVSEFRDLATRAHWLLVEGVEMAIRVDR